MHLLSTSSFQFTDAIPWLIAFAGVVVAIYFGRKNYKLNLEKRREERRRHELEEGARARAGLEKKSAYDNYRLHVFERFRYIDFTGLNAFQKKLPLERVFIRLRAKKEYRLEQYSTIQDFEKLKEEISEEQDHKKKGENFAVVFIKSLKEASKKGEALRMLILGHPGSGKTTLFKWIALQCVKPKKQEADIFFNNYIPVFISLKDFTSNPEWLRGNLEDLVLSSIGSQNLDAPFYKERFERSEIIFLLDGLDEVADEDLRREVIAWIEKQNIRRNRLLVSSRFSGLNQQKGLVFNADFNSFVISDLDEADIEQFLHQWYEAIETVLEDTVENRREAKRQADELINELKKKEHEPLRRIAVNPLLLTIVAIVHRNRAQLPKERHKLYDECLNVMIELWHVANKKLKVSFPADVCKNNLSKLAHHAMLQNKREVSRQEITELLPAEIEGKPLNFFLGEMVLNAGLLYESEGKYGFLHLTFQEYLAAWHYARSSQPLDILQHRDQDYWTETIKLFVNLGNTRQFFEEIIAGLDEKYWQNLGLWDELLMWELIDEKMQEEIERKFAEKICGILLNIPYQENEESKIVQLFPHYALYKHADFLESQGWQMFREAKHPFVKTIGVSILNRCKKETQYLLFEALKEKIKHPPTDDSIDVLFEFDNTISLLTFLSRKISDFLIAIKLLKHENLLVVLLDLRFLNDLDYLGKFKDLLDLLDFQHLFSFLGLMPNYINELVREQVSILHGGYPHFEEIQELLAFRDFKDYWYLHALRHLPDLGYVRDYYRDYKYLFEELLEYQPEIHAWADKAIQKLHDLSDDEVLKYFPGTTEEELREFRSSKTD